MTDGNDAPRLQRAHEAHTDEETLAVLEPEVATWFTERFDRFTPPQRFAVKELHERRNVLISSPTGSGKTLSAFLAAINELVALAKRGALEDRVYVLYVSPLKALNNDIERNLQGPLEGICDEVEAATGERPDIRTGVRTGDTPRSERARMTRTPPHILITTPESLAILLNAPKFREHLRGLAWIIVDEVHALAENKRGTHLTLSLERLVAGTQRPPRDHEGPFEPPPEPVRIGLSATVEPLEAMAGFLVGRASDGGHRPCLLVDVSFARSLELRVLATVPDPIALPPSEVQEALYDALDQLIDAHRTTLIFTNTRAGTERVVHHLQERFGEKYLDRVGAHHGSLSKERREEIEQRLQDGTLKVVVTSTSLELGIDIGHIDLVVLLSSPKGAARALQRIGRSGHQLHATSTGVLVALDHADLLECAVIAHDAREGRLDPVRVPHGPLDVLCQHLVGMSVNRRWDVDEALAVVRRAEPYHDLTREDLEACLGYLGGREALDDRHVYAKLWYDDATQAFGRRGSRTRMIYFTNIGTIPDTTQIKVFHGERFVGSVEEEFIESLTTGDVFSLGGSTWQYRGASPVKARVVPARSKRPTVPMWFSEQMPMSATTAQRVHAVRAQLGDALRAGGTKAATAHLVEHLALNEPAANSLAQLAALQEAYVGLGRDGEVVVEEHDDLEGNVNLVFHTPLGRHANEALARAFAHRVGQMRSCKVPWRVDDHGFLLTIPPLRRLTVEQVRGLFLMDLERELFEALERSELVRRRFRHVATRALMILRNYKGRSISVGRQNAQARKLLRHLERELPDNPVLKETYREILHDALDLPTARRFLFRFVAREMDVRYVRGLPGPSPFSFNLVAATGANTMLAEEATTVLQRYLDTVERHIARRVQ